MAILKIKSKNKNLSFVLQKNPNSGLYVRSHKNGVLFGYFPLVNEKTQLLSEYIIHFKDASDNVSYKRHPDEQFEYLNASKYNDARFINDAIQNVLHSARESKGDSEKYDVIAEQEIFVNLCETEFRTIDIFHRYFDTVSIEEKEISKDNYQLSFKSTSTLSYLLKVVNLFSIFATLNSPTYNYFTEDLIAKYIRIANDVDAPYFIKYLIKIRMCRSENKFNTFKEELEISNRYKINLTAGDTHQARIDTISSMIKLDKSIVDIGTGIDYRYLKLFAPKLQAKELQYYVIEKDPDALARIKAGLKNRNLEDSVEVFESLDEFIKYKNDFCKDEIFDVICTEVLEHNEFEDAKAIVKKVCDEINFDISIFTVPNFNFNQFYNDTGGFRHDDHKFEPTVDEVKNLIPKEKIYKVFGIGDSVNDIYTSIGFSIINTK